MVQTIVLFLVEVGYLALKVVYLRSNLPNYKLKVVLCSLSSMLRMCFIVTFFIYEEAGSPFIMNLVHYDIVCLYLICWLVEFIHDLIAFTLDIKDIVRDAITGKCRSQKKPSKNVKKQKAIHNEKESKVHKI